MKKFISLMLSLLMLVTMIPMNLISTYAATTAVYIDEGAGKTPITDLTIDQAGTGWSWDSANQVLVLDGYNAKGISATGDLSIRLVGTNTVTVGDDDVVDGYAKAFDVSGTLTIDKTTSDTTDKLIVNANTTSTSAGSRGFTGSVVINGGTVEANMTDVGYGAWCFNSNLTVKNTANVNIVINSPNARGVDGSLYAYTSGTISIDLSAGTGKDMDNSCVGTLYPYGSGDIILKSNENGRAICDLHELPKGTSTITVEGLICITSAPDS